jgi:hypothetical protein
MVDDDIKATHSFLRAVEELHSEINALYGVSKYVPHDSMRSRAKNTRNRRSFL